MQSKAEKGFWVWLRWSKDAPKNAWEGWSNWKASQLWSTTGEWDCKIWISEDNLKKFGNDISEYVWNLRKENKWVAATSTEWAMHVTE